MTDPCAKCRGDGRELREAERQIAIPPGLEHGTAVRAPREGNVGRFGEERGDLFVLVQIAPHKIFERRGRDLACEAELGIPLAALGGKFAVPTLEGTEEVTIKPGTQTGTVLTLRGHGLPGGGSVRSRGDLHVVVTVKIPTKLSAKQRRLLEEFSSDEAEPSETSGGKGIFRRFRGPLNG